MTKVARETAHADAKVAMTHVVGVVTLLVSIVSLVVVLVPNARAGPNACAMSYMYPTFTEIPSEDVRLASETHRLYRYVDARDAERSADDRTCVVHSLYVPGSGGSHAQARSVGSGTRLGAGCSVEHYALDFGREHGVYNGKLLSRQGASVKAALAWLRARGSSTRTRGTVLVGHSAGGLAAMDAIGAIEGALDVDAVVALASPLGWNPVSLTVEACARERSARTRWRAVGAESRVVVASVVGGARDRQVSSMAMGNANAWVDDGLWISASAPEIANVGVAIDHQCATWCKQLVSAVAQGFERAFPDPRPEDDGDGELTSKMTPREIANGFRDAFGEIIESSDGSAFGVPSRFYETVQERTPSVFAGVVAHLVVGAMTTQLVPIIVFAVVAHFASPPVLRERPAESFAASIAVCVACGSIARFARSFGERRALFACQLIAYTPSLIAWAHHAWTTFARGVGFRDVVAPFGPADAACVAVAVAFITQSSTKTRPTATAINIIAGCTAAYASAPGNGGLAHVACAVFAFGGVIDARRAKLD